MLSTTNIAKLVEDLDWSRILSEDECEGLAGLFDEEDRFRTTVDMRRVRFGSGVYRYFDNLCPRRYKSFERSSTPRSRR
jgi:uncharacterized protein